MNTFFIYTLKALRMLYAKTFGVKPIKPECEQNPDKVSQIIYDALMANRPCMIARFGAFELGILTNYIGIRRGKRSNISYIKGNELDWWWNESLINSLHTNAGFFPTTVEKIAQFCELIMQEIPQVDILGSWLPNENYFETRLANAEKIRLMYLDPFWSKKPWTKALKGKKILVVHPFAESILNQYEKRKLLFENKDILSEFKSLTVIKAVQSLEKVDDRFADWFEALDYMKKEIERCDFDICLIGCGAYGFPLAAYIKRMGKKAVHMVGSLQLLFGIKGKRWEVNDPHYEQPHNVFIDYYGLPNKYWVRPSENERPINYKKVEDSSYW